MVQNPKITTTAPSPPLLPAPTRWMIRYHQVFMGLLLLGYLLWCGAILIQSDSPHHNSSFLALSLLPTPHTMAWAIGLLVLSYPALRGIVHCLSLLHSTDLSRSPSSPSPLPHLHTLLPLLPTLMLVLTLLSWLYAS